MFHQSYIIMKNVVFFVLVFFISNVSFSQEEKKHSNTKIDKKETVFKCYPNPVENELFVLGTHKIKSIAFINVLGNQVAFYQFDKSIIKLNVSELKSGVYLMKVIDEHDTIEVKRLVKK